MSKPINYAKVARWAISARRIHHHSARARWLQALLEGREPYWAPDY
jgi:hypothetical protein